MSRFIRQHTAGGDGVDYSSRTYNLSAAAGMIATTVATEGLGGEAGGAEAGSAELSAEGKALSEAEPVGSALKDDVQHRAATFMRDEAAKNGTHFQVVGGDGVTRTLTQVPGELNGTAGRYEYLVEGDKLTHQRFVPGGRINGIPNKP